MSKRILVEANAFAKLLSFFYCRTAASAGGDNVSQAARQSSQGNYNYNNIILGTQ